MGCYRECVLPHLLERACRTPALAQWRESVTAGLAGSVVEIGFGSGLNLVHYPPAVEVVMAVEPAAVSRRIAARREARAALKVEHVGLDGESIELPDASADGGLSTFTLCTIPDAGRALRELRRVIRPGGRFHFLEHGLAPDAPVAKWQWRLDGLQGRLAGGCHLTRDIPALITAAGFEIERLEQRYAEGPRMWSWFTIGVARNPG
jgi:SAM-dependent methyltransferase